jgi:hypothetical protein
VDLAAGELGAAEPDPAGHADSRTTRRYDRARYSLDRSPGYALAGYLAETESGA